MNVIKKNLRERFDTIEHTIFYSTLMKNNILIKKFKTCSMYIHRQSFIIHPVYIYNIYNCCDIKTNLSLVGKFVSFKQPENIIPEYRFD